MATSNFKSLLNLVEHDIPEDRKQLQENYSNLEQVAKYCESNYLQAGDKRKALEETKDYTTHSLASVAYQVNKLATHFLQLLDLQTSQLANMESSVNNLSQIVMIHKEKVARREIGVLTTNRTACRPAGLKGGCILFPDQSEQLVKYSRKPIDYSLLDDVGHGGRSQAVSPVTGRSPSISSAGSGFQAPTTRPPTPPQHRQTQAGGITHSAGGTHYRSIPPPSVPSSVSHGLPSTPDIHLTSSLSIRFTELPTRHTTVNVKIRSLTGDSPCVGMATASKSQGDDVAFVRNGALYAPGASIRLGQVHMPQGVRKFNVYRDQELSTGGMLSVTIPRGPNMPSDPVSGSHGTQCLSQQSSVSQGSMASPPLPPPPEGSAHHKFDYRSGTSEPPVEFSDTSSDDTHSTPAQPYEDPYASTGPGFVGASEVAPLSYLEKVVAIYDYDANKPDELSFSENSVVYVIRKNDDGWWEGVMDGVAGLFPSNYVEPCM